MIQEIYKIGKSLSSVDGDPVLKYIERSKLSNTKKVLCIKFNISGGSTSFERIDLEDYSDDNAIRYLYRPGASNGPDVTPTSIITEIKKTFSKKILKWFEDYKDDAFLNGIYNELSEKKEDIQKQLLDKNEGFTKEDKKNVLLTIKFRDDSGEKYLGDCEKFREILIKSAKERYSSRKSGGESKGKGVCYLCSQNKDVSGFVLPSLGFSFSTPDKLGFIGGFKSENRWKEIPICEDCASILEIGKKYVDENLSFRFFQYAYYVIPSVILPFQEDDILRNFIKQVKYYKGQDYHKGLVSDEDYISDYVSKQSNAMRLMFIFYSKKTGGKYLNIIRAVEDVLPSQLKRITDYQSSVKKKFPEELAKEVFGNNTVGDVVTLSLRHNTTNEEGDFDRNNWYFSMGNNLFMVKDKGSLKDEKFFLYYVTKILTNNPFDRSLLISAFMNVIRREFRSKKDYLFKLKSLETLMIYELLIQMGLMEGEKMDDNKEPVAGGTGSIEAFFQSKSKVFPNVQAKASFLVGALVNYLLYVQRIERGLNKGDEPFLSKLYGLNIDEKRIKKIYKEAIQKLLEYSRSSILEDYAGQYLLQSGNGWNLTRDDISYYFTLGLIIGKLLYPKENLGDDNDGNKKQI